MKDHPILIKNRKRDNTMILNEKQIKEGDSYHELKKKTSLGEILETASNFEKTAHTFYVSLETVVGEQLRPLVRELAEEEKNHYELFLGLSKHPHVQPHMDKMIETPPNNHIFSDYIQSPPISDFIDEKSILLYAMSREQAALEQYTILAEETPAGPVQDLFFYLAHEEQAHKKEIEKRYYALTPVE